MRFNPESKQFKLFQALTAGEQLTEAQIAARFGLKNPRAAVSNLRLEHGVAVYANEKFDTKGRRTVKYRIGAPSRKVVAAGYRALAQGMTV
jgi:hypothetical protein